jgi:protein-disulfide isomerase
LELALSIVGVAGVIVVVQGMQRAGLLQTAAWAYWVASAAIAAVFLSSATVPRDATATNPRVVSRHLLQFVTRRATWLCAVGAVIVVGIAPRSMEVPEGGAAFRRWYSRQPRAPIPFEWQVRDVTLVAVTDYQCPSCRLVEARYRDVIRQAEDKYGDRFIFIRRDFPLEGECNPTIAARGEGGVHLAACEAAAAVRLAGQVSDQLQEAIVDWLWTNQRELDREMIFEAAEQEFQLDLASRYGFLLPCISADAASAGRASVIATPTHFLNGTRLRGLSAGGLAEAIDLEISRLGGVNSGPPGQP